MEASEATTVADIIRRKLEEARNQLIARNLRNKLVNCALTSKRSKQVRVVDEVPDEVFKRLLVNKRDVTFAPGRGLQSEDEQSPDDRDYVLWTPPESAQVSEDGAAPRRRDNVLQTQLTPEGLQKRLTALYYESIESEEEQGVNVLYLAIGFIRWFEDERSEVERFAPLILIPVELTRKGARERFQLKARDEDLYTNVSLKVWLSEQHAIDLPDLPDTDDWLPSEYFASVRKVISQAPRWAVLESEILLGFFSFNKFLLWRDLDPKNWPEAEHLLGHGILRTLLAPHEEGGQPDPPVIPDDERIDQHFNSADQVSILDTDSSQTIAIQTALRGRNLVIQGPPGTGKSQTIANIIAAAIHAGKSVLFVAEKLAALEVVYERLRSVNLSALCFQLHSRRASKQQVLSQLRDALNTSAPPAVPQNLCTRLDRIVLSLWAHSDRLHRPHPPSGYTPFQVLGRICRLRDQGTPAPDFSVKAGESFSTEQIRGLLEDAELAAERLEICGVPARHPWRDCNRGVMNPLDVERLAEHSARLATSVEPLIIILRSVWPLVRSRETEDLQHLHFSELPSIAKALALAAGKPPENLDLLCAARWNADLPLLERLAGVAQKLTEIEKELQPIFSDAAWELDWSRERTEIAGSGTSLFRFLRPAYRQAIRRLRGACREAPPKRHLDRLSALDRLMEGQDLRRKLTQFGEPVAADLGALLHDLPAAWPRLSALIGWLRTACALEPRLSVRNRKLLGWSESSQKWSERLTTAMSSTATQLASLGSFVRLSKVEQAADPSSFAWTLGELVERTRAWRQSSERFNEWPPARDHLARILELTGSDFHRRIYAGEILPTELRGRIELAICEQVWNGMCRVDAELARIDGRLLDKTVGTFRDLDQARISAAALEVAKCHFDRKPTGSTGEMAVVRQEMNKSRRLMAVRKLLDLAGNAIQILKPVFLMSPLSVAQYLAPGRLKFDLLLIDEASQVRPEDALGAVARAGQIVVVGDPKQLPPTNFFNRLISDADSDEDAELDAGTPVIGAMESILSLCDATLGTRAMLRWHYRSHHPALIAVSNYSFYENKLLLPPSVAIGQHADGFGVVFRKTPNGSYDRGRSATNVAEAELVAEAVCSFARENPEKTLGVGTFSVAQRDIIRDRIDARRRAEPDLESFFASNRTTPFFVKNLESIQGDERDVIFISVGYGRDREGRLAQNFGPINNDGGERRLNVLISRAKERCEVFSSLTADDVDVSTGRAGVVALKHFLQFAEKGYLETPTHTGRPFDSDFEESVANFLTTRGFKVHPQVGMAGFYIDLGVLESESSGRYLLGIECDGATYHSSRSARDRDRIRQQILESRGWRIHRIWSSDWFNRRAAEEHRVLDALERARRTPVRPDGTGGAPRPPILHEPTPELDLSAASPRDTEPYTEARFKVQSTLAPHEAPEKVRDAVRRIVHIEGPVHEEEVGRRIATIWGLDRAGSRIQEAARLALIALEREGQLLRDGRFWTDARMSRVRVRDRSGADSSTLRKAEFLPPSEISIAASEVVKESVRVSLEELVIEVARRLGFHRTGQDLQDIILRTVRAKIGSLFREQGDGSLMLNSSH